MTLRDTLPRRARTSPTGARTRRHLTLAAALAAALTLVAAPALAAPAGGDGVRGPGERAAAAAPSASAVPGEVLVGLRPGTGGRARAEAARRAGARIVGRAPAPGVMRLRVDAGGFAAALADLRADPAVAWAEPNRYRRLAVAPNDPLFPQLWGLQNRGQTVNGLAGLPGADIDAVAAWDLVPSGPAPLVAVVDTGIALDHPDLTAGIATNPGEQGDGRESNGVDDDGNGLVDDWRGWDFVDGDNDPSDPDGHGTHVAGTLGARSGNGTGGSGVAGSARLLPLRVAGPHGASDADIAAAFAYAGRRGARVVNASLGGPGASTAIDVAMLAFPETLFVFPAGNAAHDNDVIPEYPCASAVPNAICVAATDQSDGLAAFSGFGATSVHLGAPGTNVLSTAPGAVDPYRVATGTSVAAPHVAGTAALLLQAAPEASTAQVRDALLVGVDPLPALAGRTVTGGRLNALRSLQALLGLPLGGSPPPALTADSDEDPPAAPGADPTPADPEPEAAPAGEVRPLRAGSGARRPGPGRITLSVAQLRINQRISQAALRRVKALEALLEGRTVPAPPTTSRPARFTLSVTQLRINQRISQAAVRRVNALAAGRAGEPAPKPRTAPARGDFTLSASQMLINQRVAQAAVRRINALTG